MKKILVLLCSAFLLTGCNFDINIKDSILLEFYEKDLEYIIFQEDSLNMINETALALNLLEENDININLSNLFKKNNTTIDKVKEHYKNKEITDIYTAYNMCVVYELLDLENDNLKNYFLNPVYDSWGELTTLKCLQMLDVNETLEIELENKIANSIDDYNDADTIGYKMTVLKENTPNEFKELLKTFISEEGVYNEYSGINAATTATALVGVLCTKDDINDYNVNNISLYDSLLTYRVEGGFHFNNELDLKYSTPQAFLALSCYYIYELNEEVELY